MNDATAATAAQLRDTLARLLRAQQRLASNPEIWIFMDSGYAVAYISHVLADLSVVLVGRLHSDRVIFGDPGSAPCGKLPIDVVQRATRHDIGKTVRRSEPIREHQARQGAMPS
jgi:hypothetical protein